MKGRAWSSPLLCALAALAIASPASRAAGQPAAPDTIAGAAAIRSRPAPSATPSRAARRRAAAAGADVAAPSPAVRWRAVAGLELIFDDNILRYSADDLASFAVGDEPGKFAIHSRDDLIIAPSLEIEARHRLFSVGDTRWRLRVKRWGYLLNPLKSNSNLALFARQDFGPSRSLELSYAYSPEQYIRHLTDRQPYAPADDPLRWEAFRYTRNGFTAIARQRLGATVAGRLTVERVLRFYNRAFMENDTWSWSGRGALTWAAHPRLSLTLDYAYEKGTARGYDQAGETRTTSDDSDASYDRDLYQFEVAWQPPLPDRWLDTITLTGQHMVYWFTSRKALVDDPYHVGRQDQTWQYELALGRAVGPRLTVELGARYATRGVRSPWPGAIVSEDKDYTARRAWLGLTWKI